MNFQEAIAWLYGNQLHGIKLGLSQIRQLLEALGVRPEAAPQIKFLHVAGTNGKGSVCAMLDAICRAAGFKTGLFISPHLVSFRERIRINGEMIAEAELAAGLSRIRAASGDWETAPTFFEIATALALEHFQKCGAEIVILETGLGGRLDATNVVTPVVSVLSAIDLDHQQWLGDTLGAIAREKAGIIKPGIPAVSLPQPEEALAVLREVALERNAPFTVVHAPMERFPLSLAGSHQRWNAALALDALAAAGIPASPEAIASGLKNTEWPGRFQALSDRVTADGAHNPAAARRLVETWREVHGPEKKATLIVGILKDKDVAGVCQALCDIAVRVIALPVRNERTCATADVAAAFCQFAPGLECESAGDFAEALGKAEAHPEQILISGSLFLVGEALAHYGGKTTEPSAQ